MQMKKGCWPLYIENYISLYPPKAVFSQALHAIAKLFIYGVYIVRVTMLVALRTIVSAFKKLLIVLAK